MHNKLLKYFNGNMPLTQEESDTIAATMCIGEFKKGTILLRKGQVSTEAYFFKPESLSRIRKRLNQKH